MAQRIEWRFSEPSVLSIGHWYLEWGNPNEEALLTLTQVIQASDNPIWCLREHAAVLARIIDGAEDLLADLASVDGGSDAPMRLVQSSPMVASVIRAHNSIQHALALLVDALVECRKGPVQMAMQTNQTLASDLAFALSDAVNCCYRLERHLPLYEG